MRVNIFDNGLRYGTGHHFDYSLNLARSLTQRGHSVSVWGALGMPDDVIAAFRQVGSQASAFPHFISLKRNRRCAASLPKEADGEKGRSYE